MEQTSRLSIVVDASNAEANIERLRTSLRNLSQDAINASQRLRDIARQNPFARLNPHTIQNINSFNRLNQTINNNSTAFNNFSRTINTTNNHFVRMGDTINRNITVINNYNSSVNNTHNALSRLQGLLAGGMFTMMGLNILKTADAMQSLDSQIKLVTKSEEEYLTVRQKVREIADKNYADIEATTNLYQNSARALANLGKTQQEALVFTNAVSLAMRTGGKSALEQKSALYQLGQAMQSGVLNGDEFRSISENAPILLDLVAKKLNVTRGEVKELASEGKITSQVIYETLANATPMLEEMAKKMPVTMGQAFALVRNKYKEFIGDFMNNDTGLSGVIAKSLVVASSHFNTFAKVAVAGAGVAMLGFANRVLASGTALTKLATIMNAHPIFAMASVVMAVSVANRGLDETLNDLSKTLSVFGVMIKDTLNLFEELGGTAYDVFRDITSNAGDSTQQSSRLFGGFFSDVGGGFEGLVKGTAKTFDAMAIMAKTFGQKTGELLGYVASNTGNIFKLMANNIADVFERVVNSVINNSVNFIINRVNDVIDFTNSASGLLGIDPMQKLTPFESRFSVGRFQVGSMVATRSWQELFDENAKSQIQNGALSYVNGLYSATNALPPSASLNNPMGEYQKPKDKDKDKKKKESQKDEDFSNRPLQLSIYRALVDEGASSNQALAIVAEIGRENDFNANLIFGTHTDPAKDGKGKSITNYGMMSWNGTRGKELMKFLEQGGAIKNGKMVRSQETLQLQARFLLKEALERKGKLSHFWGNPDADPESYAKELGKHLVVWAYGQNTIRGKNGGRVAFDWLKHDRRRRNHLKDITNLVNNSGYKGGRSTQDIIQDSKKQQQSQQEIQSWFATERQKRDDEFFKRTDEIIKNFSGDEQARLLGQLTDQFLKTDRYIELKFELDNKGDLMNKWERFAKELEVKLAGIDADTSLTDEERQAQKEQAHREQAQKSSEMILADKQEYLELNKWRMPYLEALKLEKDIAIERLNIGRTAQDIEKNGLTEGQKALEDLFDFKIEQYYQDQRLKIAELDQLNLATQQGGRYAEYLDKLHQKTMSKPSYERWKLNNEFAKGEAEENARYQEFQDKVNTKDDTDNYVIEDALERQRLLQDAERNHLNEIHAMREEYAERSKQIERDSHDERMSLYSQALSMTSNVWGDMTNVVKDSLGEQSTAYKIMFGLQKSLAIAQAIINTEQGATKALAEGGAIMGIPMATMVRATGYASIGLMAGQAIAGFATGGYTGNIGTSQIAGVVHGQEYVLNAKATKRIGVDTLNRLNKGDSIGGGVNVVINNYSNETATAEQTPNGDIMVTIGKVVRQIAQNEIQQYHRNQFRQGGAYYGK